MDGFSSHSFSVFNEYGAIYDALYDTQHISDSSNATQDDFWPATGAYDPVVPSSAETDESPIGHAYPGDLENFLPRANMPTEYSTLAPEMTKLPPLLPNYSASSRDANDLGALSTWDGDYHQNTHPPLGTVSVDVPILSPTSTPNVQDNSPSIEALSLEDILDEGYWGSPSTLTPPIPVRGSMRDENRPSVDTTTDLAGPSAPLPKREGLHPEVTDTINPLPPPNPRRRRSRKNRSPLHPVDEAHPLLQLYVPGTEPMLQIKQRPYGPGPGGRKSRHPREKKYGPFEASGSSHRATGGKDVLFPRPDVELGIPASLMIDSELTFERAQQEHWLDPAFDDPKELRMNSKFSVRIEVVGCGSHESSKQYNEWSTGKLMDDYFQWGQSRACLTNVQPLSKLGLAHIVANELEKYMRDKKRLKCGSREVQFDHIVIVRVTYPTKASVQPILGILPEFTSLYV
ncbi:hypothetical protein FKP32DRAFT_1680370 [Trametes sanguinea]|nr:hypothetical protein FKP32DRAFT_1680370 [Trametes sanguinea]